MGNRARKEQRELDTPRRSGAGCPQALDVQNPLVFGRADARRRADLCSQALNSLSVGGSQQGVDEGTPQRTKVLSGPQGRSYLAGHLGKARPRVRYPKPHGDFAPIGNVSRPELLKEGLQDPLTQGGQGLGLRWALHTGSPGSKRRWGAGVTQESFRPRLQEANQHAARHPILVIKERLVQQARTGDGGQVRVEFVSGPGSLSVRDTASGLQRAHKLFSKAAVRDLPPSWSRARSPRRGRALGSSS